MRAITWQGRGKITCETVPDPKIEEDRDAIIKVTACAICGSDLHLMGGYVPTMQRGDVLGHETMGEVVEVGAGAAHKLKVGDRVVVPFTISCGDCNQCRRGNFSCCQRTNPNGAMQAQQYGYPLAGLFGYSHITGGFPGGQAEYLRVPYADVGPQKVPSHLSDEQVLFLSDIFPTAWMAAENCDIKGGETVVVLGCGPIGQLAIRSLKLLGAERVIAVDTVAERLGLARTSGAEVIDFANGDVLTQVKEMTGGEGPDAVIDAVGLESHGTESLLQRAGSAVKETLSTSERPYSLNSAFLICRPGGTVSLPGVYAGFVNGVAMGAYMQKGLTMRTGQTHMQRYTGKLLERIERGDIDPSFIITHRVGLDDIPQAYETFRDKQDGCIKVVARPHG